MIQKNKNLLKEYLKKQDFNKCNKIIETELIEFFSKKVLEKNSDFHYTTLENLKNNISTYLNDDLAIAFNKFYFLQNFEENSHYEFQELMELYKFVSL